MLVCAGMRTGGGGGGGEGGGGESQSLVDISCHILYIHWLGG